MDVKCNNCSAEYSLDETLVAVTGTSVRCTKCGEVFRVFRDNTATGREDRWLLQQADGATYTFDRMGQLQQWIAEGKVSEDDLLAREGEESLWKRIGDIREMKPFFSLVNPPQPRVEVKSTKSGAPKGEKLLQKQTADLLGAPAGRTAPAARTSKPAASGGEGWSAEVLKGPAPSEPDLSQIPPSTADAKWDEGAKLDVKGPAWAERRGSLPRYRSEVDSLPPPKRRIGRWIAFGLLIALLAAGGVFFFFRKEMEHALAVLLSSSDENRYKQFYDRGRENFLLDSESYYRQADREFQKVLALEDGHVPTMAALAETYAVWAQYLKDAEIDARADLSLKEEVTEADNRELERLHKEFEEKLSEAKRWAKQAVSQNPDLREANRAMGEVDLLLGELHQCRAHLEKARAAGTDPETEYLAVLLDLEVGKSASELDKRLQAIIQEKPLLRAIYRRARILASEDDGAKAKEILKELFDLNSDHLRGRDLAARIDEGKPVLLVASSAQEAIALTPENAPPQPEVKATPEPAPDAGQPVAAAEPAAKPQPEKKAAAAPAAKEGAKPPPAVEAAELPTGSVDAMLAKAKQLQERGQSKTAMEIYNRVLERSPSNIDALSGVGYCYSDIGANGKAIASFRRALSVNPSFGPAILGLAETFKNQGDKPQALKYYQDYLKTNPGGTYADMARRNATQLEQDLGTSGAPAETNKPEEKPPASQGVTEIPPAEEKAPSNKTIIIRPISGDAP